MMHRWLWVGLSAAGLLVTGCQTLITPLPKATTGEEVPTSSPPSLQVRQSVWGGLRAGEIYHFLHHSLPEEHFASNGALLADLEANGISGLHLLASALGLTAPPEATVAFERPDDDTAIAVIALPPPMLPYQCHAVALVESRAGDRYFVLEHSGTSEPPRMLEWDRFGETHDRGPRPGASVASFAAEIRRLALTEEAY